MNLRFKSILQFFFQYTVIKATIMNKYLRLLNQNMSLYLKRDLEAEVELLELDSNFNEKITNFSTYELFSLSEACEKSE